MKKFIPLIIYFFVNYCYGQSFINPSVELWSSTSICEKNVPPDGWSNYSNVGLGPDEANFTICPTTIPPAAADGNVYARCLAGNPNTGEGMYQDVSGFTAGMNYMVSYKFCGSNRWGGSGDCIWHLYIDNIDVNQSAIFSSADTVWHTNHYTFTASSIIHKIGVRAYTPTYNGGGSAAIDFFTISQTEPTGISDNSLSTNITISPNPFENILTIGNKDNTSLTFFTLFDITGRVFFSLRFVDFLSIDTGMLPRGIYFYRISNESTILKKGKVVKG